MDIPPEPTPEMPKPFLGAIPGSGRPVFRKIGFLIPVVVMLIVGFATFAINSKNSLDYRSRATGTVPTPMPTSAVPLSTNALQLKTLTLALLSLNADRKNASATQAQTILGQMNKLGLERKVLLVSALSTDPQAAWDTMLGDTTVKDFPADLQPLFEREFSQKGILTANTFKTATADYSVYVADSNTDKPASGAEIVLTGFVIDTNLLVEKLIADNEQVRGVSDAKKCVMANPRVQLAPINQYGEQGQQVVYTATITNRNTACKSNNFSLQFSTLSPYLTGPVKNQIVAVAEGSLVHTPISVFSTDTAVTGTHQFTIKAVYTDKPIFNATASATYSVFPR